jgi:hypothetical protein
MAIRKGRIGAYASGLLSLFLIYPKMLWKRLRFWPTNGRALLAWLRESEWAIYEDISARPREQQDTYWRMYFALFRPKRAAGAALTLAQQPEAEAKQKAGPSRSLP